MTVILDKHAYFFGSSMHDQGCKLVYEASLATQCHIENVFFINFLLTVL